MRKIALIGESGSGKSTIEKFLETYYGYSRVISTTSRSPREGEKNGVSYHFETKEKMLEDIENGLYVEHQVFNGNLYGMTKREMSKSDKLVIVVAYQGLKELKEIFGDDFVGVYISTTEEVRRDRMRRRGDSSELIESRILNDRLAFEGVKEIVDLELDCSTITALEAAGEIIEFLK